MDAENHGKTLLIHGWFGGKPTIFWKHPYPPINITWLLVAYLPLLLGIYTFFLGGWDPMDLAVSVVSETPMVIVGRSPKRIGLWGPLLQNGHKWLVNADDTKYLLTRSPSFQVGCPAGSDPCTIVIVRYPKLFVFFTYVQDGNNLLI